MGLEIRKDSTGITYALDATGDVATVGLPANSLALSGKVEARVSTIAGVVNDPVPVSSAAGDTVTLSFSGPISQVTGSNLTLSLGGVVTISGSFMLTKTSDTAAKLLLSAANVNAFIGTPDQSIGIKMTGINLGLLLENGASGIVYALDTSAQSIALVGFGGAFTLSGSVEIRANGTGGAVTDSIPLAGGGSIVLPFSGAANIPLAFSGSMTLAVPGFASLTLNDFALQELAPVVSSSLTTTEILMATSGASAFLGIDDANPANRTGVSISGTGIALELVLRTGAGLNGLPAFSFALESTGGTAQLLNFPDLTLSAGSLSVKVNTTGAGVATQTITTAGGPVSIGFTDGSNGTDDERNLTDIEGNITIAVTNGSTSFASLSGDFGFKKLNLTDGTGSVIGTRFIIGAKNVNAVLGTDNINATISGANLGLVLDKTASATEYALFASQDAGSTVQLNGVAGLTLSGSGLSVTVTRGMAPATVAAISDSVHTSAGTVTLNLSGLGTSTSTVNVTTFSGTATLAVHGFITLTGTFSFNQQDDTRQ